MSLHKIFILVLRHHVTEKHHIQRFVRVRSGGSLNWPALRKLWHDYWESQARQCYTGSQTEEVNGQAIPCGKI